MKSVVGEKGQVTIPKRLRDELGIQPGSTLEFVEDHGKLVARTIVKGDPIAAMTGILPRENVDALIDEMRGPGWNADLDGKTQRADRRR